MRKSTTYSMLIILLALVGMMIAADMALKPMRQMVGIGRELTAIFRARGDIEQESDVVTVARAPEERHLAKKGWGMIVEMTPSETVRTADGRMTRLVYRAVKEAGRLYQKGAGKRLDWFEIKLMLPGDKLERTLIRVSDEGHLSQPEPPLPVSLPQ